jgi:ABC-2 type transport system ATP-binding protein
MYSRVHSSTIGAFTKPSIQETRMATIEVEHLRKRYGETIAVRDVSFSIEDGEIFGILGPNGAGKSTTVECIAGLREPDGGRVSVLGLDPRRDHDELRQILGVQLQGSELPPKLEVGEALDLYASFYRDPADPRDLLAALGLESKRGTRFQELSGGQRQRLSIALALVGRPRIAVLDELTTGLDPQARRDTWSLIAEIRDRGVTIILVTHFMEEAERLCDRVALIDAGAVAAIGTPGALADTAGGEQRIHFQPSIAFDDVLLADLPEVRTVSRRGEQVTVSGSGDVLGAVISLLAGNGIVARHLRVEQTSLEDAFVALTGPREGTADGRDEAGAGDDSDLSDERAGVDHDADDDHHALLTATRRDR